MAGQLVDAAKNVAKKALNAALNCFGYSRFTSKNSKYYHWFKVFNASDSF